MSSEKSNIPFRTLSIVLAAGSAIIPFAKWFRLDIAGLASLFSIDTSFSIFQLRDAILAIYGQVPPAYSLVLILFVAMAVLQAVSAAALFLKHATSSLVSTAACIYSTLLSLVAIAFCTYVSSQSGGFTLGFTLFPVLAIALAVGESICVAKEEGRPFLTRAQLLSLLLLVVGAVIWGFIVSLAHTSLLGDIILFLAVFQYWVMFVCFRTSNE
ncbi:MAG TPA: hypothetical protein H9890_07960 [Candidatus Faecalibacterium intestinigallinarum]|uniref:Uncharacterized protein n=1 Tax=Candidatus Faecalibacterium intestinigallinarum TaxID=2838581 RepID=A0A9D1QB17_9FIRM|nr:hypothetical protein [Candidatus Faecalibacterium intestinigallinarum]